MNRIPDSNVSQIPESQSSPATDPNASPAAAQESLASTVRVITQDDLNQKIQSGESVEIINVLDPDKYMLGLIKGSKRIPLSQLDARSGEIDKTKLVVTYCASSACNASQRAAEELTAKGFNAHAYLGGIKEWKEAGLETEV